MSGAIRLISNPIGRYTALDCPSTLPSVFSRSGKQSRTLPRMENLHGRPIAEGNAARSSRNFAGAPRSARCGNVHLARFTRRRCGLQAWIDGAAAHSLTMSRLSAGGARGRQPKKDHRCGPSPCPSPVDLPNAADRRPRASPVPRLEPRPLLSNNGTLGHKCL